MSVSVEYAEEWKRVYGGAWKVVMRRPDGSIICWYGPYTQRDQADLQANFMRCQSPDANEDRL